MAKIIPLTNCNTTVTAHTQAAWLLTYAILWHHDRLPKQEETYAKSIIQGCLSSGSLLKKSFTCYCERVLLAGKLLQAEPAAWIDQPSIWFHPQYPEGFAGTLSLYQQVAFKRQSVKRYQQGIHVFASSYWQYLQQPSDKLLQQCYRRLLRLREYGLLQLWNNVIMLHHTSK
jgi:hypothetical protein